MLNEIEEGKKPKKKVDIKSKFDILHSGKNLKQTLIDVKNIKNVVIPMGSNFERIEPDLGITIEE